MADIIVSFVCTHNTEDRYSSVNYAIVGSDNGNGSDNVARCQDI